MTTTYHDLSLFFRKTTGTDDCCRTYELHKQKEDEEGAYAFTLLIKWINFYKIEILKRKLNDDELIFPKL